MIFSALQSPRNISVKRDFPGLLLIPVFLPFFLVAAGCSSQDGGNGDIDFSRFPVYKPAAPFLKMHERLQAYEPPGPQPYPYTERNRLIAANLSRAVRQAEAEVAYRERLRSGNRRVGNSADIAGWNAYRERQAFLELKFTRRERTERRSSGRRMSRRFRNYQRRVEDMRRERDAEVRLFQMRRREALRHSRIPGTNLEGNAKLKEALENAREE